MTALRASSLQFFIHVFRQSHPPACSSRLLPRGYQHRFSINSQPGQADSTWLLCSRSWNWTCCNVLDGFYHASSPRWPHADITAWGQPLVNHLHSGAAVCHQTSAGVKHCHWDVFENANINHFTRRFFLIYSSVMKEQIYILQTLYISLACLKSENRTHREGNEAC